MSNEEYILQHREEDVRQLALHKSADGVNLKWCLQQIEGWQLARRKLPHWAQTEGMWFPPRLAMEQCSSETTARYKAALAERLIPPTERRLMADLTGGLGVDFSFMAPLFHHSIYVEIQPLLVEIAKHNMPLLGLSGASITTPDKFTLLSSRFSLLFIDPSRRDPAGRKTISIEDCTPNILDIQDELLQQASWLIVKFSPMLDIQEALRKLKCVCEVHVVSVGGECKELLFVMKGCRHPSKRACVTTTSLPHVGESEEVGIHCVNLGTDEDEIVVPLASHIREKDASISAYPSEEQKIWQNDPLSPMGEVEGLYLYEPNASILKAGISDVLTTRYAVWKLHPMSHLFVGKTLLSHFPGRRFQITGWSDFGKQNLRDFIENLYQTSSPESKDIPISASINQSGKKGRLKANLTVRNFPTSVASLRRKLKLDEGGDIYLFATTLSNGQHVLIRCLKA